MLQQSGRTWQGRTPARRSTDHGYHAHNRADRTDRATHGGAHSTAQTPGPTSGQTSGLPPGLPPGTPHARPHGTADRGTAYAAHAAGAHPDALPSFREARREALEAFEHAYLATLYEAVGGDIRQACSLSNLSRARLYELLRKHAIME